MWESFLGVLAILDALTPYFGRQMQGIEVIYVGQNMSGANINELLKYIVDKRDASVYEGKYGEEAPSNLAIMGRYVLTPSIFNALKATPVGVGGEIQLTDAIELLNHSEHIVAHDVKGKLYD